MWANSEPRRLVETVQWQGILLSNCLMVTIKADQWFYFFSNSLQILTTKIDFLPACGIDLSHHSSLCHLKKLKKGADTPCLATSLFR